MRFNIVIFAIYSILYESLVLGGTGYVVFFMGHNGWWFLLAVLMSSNQLKAKSFGINCNNEDLKK